MIDRQERRLGNLDKLFQDLNAISVIAFTPLFIFIAATLGAALDGRHLKPLLAFPWLVFMVAYWYWRYKHLAARCRDYVRAKNISEYEKTIKRDSLRTIVVGAAVFTTILYTLFEAESIALFGALLFSGLFLYSILVGLTTFTYWVSAWLDSRRARDR